MAKVLVADSSMESRKRVAGIVEELGHSAILTSTAFLVKEIVSSNPDLNLLILDAKLKDTPARELTLELRGDRTFFGPPIIIISTKICIKDIDELLRLGASYFVPKPIDPKQLGETIGKILCKPQYRNASFSTQHPYP